MGLVVKMTLHDQAARIARQNHEPEPISAKTMHKLVTQLKRGRKAKLTKQQIVSTYNKLGSVKKSCDKLGVTKKTFYDSMKRFGIKFSEKIILDK